MPRNEVRRLVNSEKFSQNFKKKEKLRRIRGEKWFEISERFGTFSCNNCSKVYKFLHEDHFKSDQGMFPIEKSITSDQFFFQF